MQIKTKAEGKSVKEKREGKSKLKKKATRIENSVKTQKPKPKLNATTNSLSAFLSKF